ncbi:adenylyl-sulfate kinase [Chloroflexota bacterium]
MPTKNIVPHEHKVSRKQRCAIKGHQGVVLWFTGLSGSGKSTIANAVDVLLNQKGIHAYLLDGDNVRAGLNSDLGFSAAERTENIRRIGEVANLFYDAGLIVLVAFISPYRADRDSVRLKLPDGAFVEVFVDCPLEVCENRDPKGLYKKARQNIILDFTGISAPYEPPVQPEITVNSAEQSIEQCSELILQFLSDQHLI